VTSLCDCDTARGGGDEEDDHDVELIDSVGECLGSLAHALGDAMDPLFRASLRPMLAYYVRTLSTTSTLCGR
jgi:hypothetical protein